MMPEDGSELFREATLLEHKVDIAFEDLKVKRKIRDSLISRVTPLRTHDINTYVHSLQVALLSLPVAKYCMLPPKPLLYAGLLHDNGKLFTPKELLSKNGSLTLEEREIIKKHVMDGYMRLSPEYEYTALILVKAHSFQDDFYPAKLPVPKVNFSKKNLENIDLSSRHLEIVDSFIARTKRDDGYCVLGRTSEEILSVYAEKHKKNPSQISLFKDLLDHGVLILI